ncbi:hypothetical protein [Parafrankia sp. BMG5.11]|uniref:hypothetical protein n=1 Tax=Parafrankia sp. BMG5.11 TaxID=222540 RepID=UPI0010393DDC|nr:hypothetical protein [Parafrankia sp. BMG5.11]TCJ37372.1 hypothetical protein E0504_20255 [Parafrankia sp. BMG5.11]
MAILSGLFLLVAVGVAIALLRPLLEFVAKLLAGMFIATAGGIALGLAAENQWSGAGPLVGLIAGTICLVPSIRLVWALYDTASSPMPKTQERQESPVPPLRSATHRIEPAGDEPVAQQPGSARYFWFRTKTGSYAMPVGLAQPFSSSTTLLRLRTLT